jgi:hypothetical protein
MPYQLPDGNVIASPRKGRSFILGGTRHPEENLLSKSFREEWLISVVPMPRPKPMLEDDIADAELRKAQMLRLQRLQQATIDQFEMILALFTAGRDKGLWAAADFPLHLREAVLEWRGLIDDFKANSN